MAWLERITAVVAGIAMVAAVSVLVARSEPRRFTPNMLLQAPAPETATPEPPTPEPAPPPAPSPTPVIADIGAVVAKHTMAVHEHPAGESATLATFDHGVIAPVLGQQGAFFQIMTPYEVVGWVDAANVETHNRAAERPNSLEGATIVLDPGHGGHLDGARGPTGYLEKDANRDITYKMLPALSAARVFLTRTDGHAGLRYRSLLANHLNAHVFVSIHNNAVPGFMSDDPGTEIYHQERNADSRRLAGLLYEELHTALSQYDIVWGKNKFAGARFRRNAHGEDYYAVLKHTAIPAVIVEGMFISTHQEEELLRRPEVQQVKADAMVRALDRFFSTADPGSGFQDPYASAVPDPIA